MTSPVKTPAESLCSSAVRVLLAVASQPSPTIRSVEVASGLVHSSVHHHLRKLKVLRLVDWSPGKSGTLRALVRFEPVGGGQ